MPDWQEALLAVARQQFDARVLGHPAPPVPAAAGGPAAAGAFVSVRIAGDLRGCLGALHGTDSLTATIARLAADVAHRDPRFAPVAAEELAQSALEISVLTEPERVVDPSSIAVGRHGLIVEQGRASGLLLPQVAVEHGWSRDAFLDHACVKAGLPRDAWRQGAIIYRFEAVVFGEAVR
ncbi:MAG: AmmeMemoRadiSam system protein A [Acidobacteriota bacterium]